MLCSDKLTLHIQKPRYAAPFEINLIKDCITRPQKRQKNSGWKVENWVSSD